ncbi:MAG: hypothetical protein NVSMB14_14340 [Isosphaeraceae bacterium]
MSRRLGLLLVLGMICGVGSLSVVGLARRQEAAKAKKVPADVGPRPEETLPPLDVPELDESFRKPENQPPFDPKDVEAIRPTPHPIPDNPPPHEGAMIVYPQIIGASDVLNVTVYTALPGRPLEGGRLVQADGTINLGYYGIVKVNGLTLEQAKRKIVAHLRQFMPDEPLGLLAFDDRGEPIVDKEGKPVMVAAENSQRVSVAFGTNASKVFYVQGQVKTTGRFPYTGNETVLDALSYAGGLTEDAEGSGLKLVRPARDGKPTKILSIYYNDLLNGEVDHNYQIFPGDRLIVPTKAVEK